MQTSTPILAPEGPPKPARDPLGHLGTLPFLGVVVLYIGAGTLLCQAIGGTRHYYVMPIASGASIVLTRVLRRRSNMTPPAIFWLTFGGMFTLAIAAELLLRIAGR